MAKCDVCSRDETMPYSCRYCGGTYCSEHRLPENHDCPGLEDWGDPGGVFDSGFDDSVVSGSSSGDLLARVGVSTGAGGLLGYFRGNASYLFLAIMWVVFLVQLLLLQTAPRLHEQLFVLSSAHPEYVWTWVTAVFAHGSFGHIVVNSIVLYFFGPVVERRIGTKKFVALFFAAGVSAGLAQIGTAILTGEFSAVVGASGAIMGVMGLLTVLNPNLRVYLYFILPVPLWLLTIGFALYSVFIALGGGIGAGGVAHLAHLVGLGIGLLYGERLRKAGERAPEQLQFGPGGRRGPRRRF
ncbi:MAG: rhomboid family intramembrane serine protease [Halobacteriales archaeon]|nr:rhomboid family intramembrane serine protease [Halobacteriales archaeon]